MKIFRRTNNNPMMTRLLICLMILPQFRERNRINPFADTKTQATSSETKTKINGYNSDATSNKRPFMKKNAVIVQTQTNIRINGHATRHFQKPNAAEYTSPGTKGQVTLQYGSIRIASGRKLILHTA